MGWLDLNSAWFWVALVAVLGVGLSVVRRVSRGRGDVYTPASELWDSDTLALFAAVSDAAAGKWLVITNVPLGRLVHLAPGQRGSSRRTKPLEELKVDFALCDRQHGNPQIVLLRTPEHDDQADEKPDPRRRILSQAGIPTLLIESGEDYDSDFLKRMIHRRAA